MGVAQRIALQDLAVEGVLFEPALWVDRPRQHEPRVYRQAGRTRMMPRPTSRAPELASWLSIRLTVSRETWSTPASWAWVMRTGTAPSVPLSPFPASDADSSSRSSRNPTSAGAWVRMAARRIVLTRHPVAHRSTPRAMSGWLVESVSKEWRVSA